VCDGFVQNSSTFLIWLEPVAGDFALSSYFKEIGPLPLNQFQKVSDV
jgi:hypothetical protein